MKTILTSILLLGFTLLYYAFPQSQTLGTSQIIEINNLRKQSQILLEKNEFKEAEKLTQKELVLREQVFGKGEFRTAISYYYLGVIAKATGNYAALKSKFPQQQ